MEAEIKSDFPKAKIELKPGKFGVFKVLLDGKIIFGRLPLIGSFPREGEITEKIRNIADNQ